MEAPRRKYQKHKTDYTISIKYFTKKNTRPIVNYKGDAVYPIYIRIVCKRQNTTIPSRLRSNVSENELDSFLEQPIISDFVKSETETLIAIVKYLNPDSDGFTFRDLPYEYTKRSNDVFNSCYQVIMYRLALAFDQQGIDKSEYETLNVDNFSSLKFMMSLGVQTAKELYERYSPMSEIRSYEQQFKGKYHTYCWFGLCDLDTSLYKLMLTDIVGSKAEEIFPLLKELGNEYFNIPMEFKEKYRKRFVSPVILYV